MNRFVVVFSLVLTFGFSAVFAQDAVLVGPIPGRYMVTLRDAAVGVPAGHGEAPERLRSLAEELSDIFVARVERTWGHAINGFVAEDLSEEQARRLARHPFVLAVEPDMEWRSVSAAAYCYGTTGFPTNTRALPPSFSNRSQAITCADPANTACIDNWGIDRIDQRYLPRDAFYSWGNNGYAVHIYIIDSGIDDHFEFWDHLGLPRVDRGNGKDFTGDGNTYDCYGHGTHVAGIAAGRTYGVAKDALLHPVKFKTCPENETFNTSWLISSVDFVRQNVSQGRWPAVANLSGGNYTEATNNISFQTAVNNLIAAGVQFVQSAGNYSRNACSYSLGNTTNALVVGGTTHTDSLWSLSNFGSCVDLFAPAGLINSAGYEVVGNGNGYNAKYCELSGTSMAAPHVTGALAIYLDANPSLTPAQLRSLVLGDATNGVLTNLGTGSPNKLLYIP